MTFRVVVSLVAMAALVCAAACGSGSSDSNSTTATPAGTPTEPYAPTVVAADFTTHVTNQYFPLEPGTVYTYAGTEDGVPQDDVVTVTSDTKMILGVECVVVHDVVSEDGQVIEDTFDWYAQDSAGNVWYFGEDTKTYENGELTGTEGSWEAGVNGAQPGIVMEANPQHGDSYRQEYLAGEAEDQARVANLGKTRQVPAGAYDNVISTVEFTALEPDQLEQKDYAPGVGFIYGTLTRGGSEETQLVSMAMP
jgi:hypothetical protein